MRISPAVLAPLQLSASLKGRLVSHVASCLSVGWRYEHFATQVCQSLGMNRCTIPTGVQFEFRPGITSGAPDPERCFESLTQLQATFTCEFRHPKNFIVLDVAEKMISINVCPDMCVKLWKECSHHSSLDDAAALIDHDPARFCSTAATTSLGVEIRVLDDSSLCLGVADVFPQPRQTWKSALLMQLHLLSKKASIGTLFPHPFWVLTWSAALLLLGLVLAAVWRPHPLLSRRWKTESCGSRAQLLPCSHSARSLWTYCSKLMPVHRQSDFDLELEAL